MPSAFSSVRSKAVAILGAAFLLSACSSNNNSNDTPGNGQADQPPPAPTPGTLVENPPPRIGSFSGTDLLNLVNLNSVATRILAFVLNPQCGVDVHQVHYNTLDPVQQPTTASAALMIPTGTNAMCQGPRPIVVYAHGTQPEKTFNIADLTNSNNSEGLLIAAAFAAQGYIVVAPNYAGLDASTLPYHPFLHAGQQSKDVSDALTAARSALPTSTAPTVTDNGRLFITGYSQGGFVAMATHRLLQANGVPVVASAPMSGPYALTAFGDAVFQGQVIESAPALVAWLLTAYQRIYGNLYATPTDAFEAPYANGIETLLPTTLTKAQVYDQGLLPREQLFSSTPPDPAYAPFTPATMPAELAPVFARGFGPQHLITNAYRAGYLQDSLAHPDGGFPTFTDGLPPAAPAHPARIALKANDLRNWSPTSPVLLCAGHNDPTVLYLNTDLMQRYWTAAGVTTSVRVLDVDQDPSQGGSDVLIRLGFSAAKQAVASAAVAGGASDGGVLAVADAYHATLVPPFCLAAVQSFFNGF